MDAHVPVSEGRELAREPLSAIRARIRSGGFADQTGGLAPGMLQGNLAILPASWAQDFFAYCQRNPKPCPLVGVSDRGDPMMRTLGADIEIRTDVPLYNIYRDGELAGQARDIRDRGQDDCVAFVLGCSYSFVQRCRQRLCRCAISKWGARRRSLSQCADRAGRPVRWRTRGLDASVQRADAVRPSR